MRLVLNLLIFVLVIGSLQSCVSKKKYDELTAAKEATDQALAETQARVKALEDNNAELQSTLESEKERLNGEIAGIKSDLDATKGQMGQMQEKLNMTEAELKKLQEEIDGIFASYTDSGLSLDERDGRLFVVTSQAVNYKSGSARLIKDQREAIEELAETLKNNPNLKILVEGHTDDDQLIEGAPWNDNWDLSVSRAMGVVRALLKHGVSPNQVAAVGRGESMPVGDNETDEGKAQNRRTLVLPDAQIGKLHKGN